MYFQDVVFDLCDVGVVLIRLISDKPITLDSATIHFEIVHDANWEHDKITFVEMDEETLKGFGTI